jgi:hypothetical protein
MSLRQLRARLDRLKARFPEDEESIARARYARLRLRIGRGEMELLTSAEMAEYGELNMSLVPHLPPATTDEERASRARWNNLRRRFRGEELGPLTEAEDIEFTELSIRYNFVGGPAIKAWRDLKEKERAEQEERSRLGQLERQKKAAAAARSRSAADSSSSPREVGRKETWDRFWEAERKRKAAPADAAAAAPAAAAAGVINYEDSSDCWPIDDD